MHDTRIGTLVEGNHAVQVPPHGFESFGLTLWQSTGNTVLAETGRRVRDIEESGSTRISCLEMVGNPLTGEGDHADTLVNWELKSLSMIFSAVEGARRGKKVMLSESTRAGGFR